MRTRGGEEERKRGREEERRGGGDVEGKKAASSRQEVKSASIDRAAKRSHDAGRAGLGDAVPRGDLLAPPSRGSKAEQLRTDQIISHRIASNPILNLNTMQVAADPGLELTTTNMGSRFQRYLNQHTRLQSTSHQVHITGRKEENSRLSPAKLYLGQAFDPGVDDLTPCLNPSRVRLDRTGAVHNSPHLSTCVGKFPWRDTAYHGDRPTYRTHHTIADPIRSRATTGTALGRVHGETPPPPSQQALLCIPEVQPRPASAKSPRKYLRADQGLVGLESTS
ncbi:unnamed protein product [Diplocarpon coronariae]